MASKCGCGLDGTGCFSNASLEINDRYYLRHTLHITTFTKICGSTFYCTSTAIIGIVCVAHVKGDAMHRPGRDTRRGNGLRSQRWEENSSHESLRPVHGAKFH